MSLLSQLSSSSSGGRKLKASPYPKALGAAVWVAAQARMQSWDKALEHLEETQLEMMRLVAAANGQSAYGRKHGIDRTFSYAQWKRNVPLSDYDSYFPYIERMMLGEHDVLVRGMVKYFGNSSGSSSGGRQKFLPITDEQIALTGKAGADAAFRLIAATGDFALPTGYQVAILPPPNFKYQGPVIVSNNPAIMSVNMPRVVRPIHLPQGDIKMEPNIERKLELIAETYFDYDVTGVSGTTCWFSLLFDKVLAEAKKRGLEGRAVSEVWPNLRAGFGGGVAAGPYLKVIQERVGNPDFRLVDTYNATEGGLYAVTDHSGQPGMLVIPDRGVFFEFVRLDEYGSDSARRIPLWEVEKDTNYVLYVSTVSGLSAYRLGDIVRFPSLKPLRMEYAGRLSGCLSTTQELTTHVEIQDAFAYAQSQVPCVAREYGCGADVGVSGTAKSQYNLFVEFEGDASGVSTEALAQAFDEGLCKVNRVYREHRAGDAAILRARLTVLPKGTVQRFMSEGALNNVQAKFPRILSDSQKDRLRELVRE
jgi:GH3 auxin-responsive promoter